ncbi:MAG TPA: PilZ domain-containing protein [Chloroflexota bacterium]|nr:PilZ domain-containing protein [Chloroflexota bacterium]
MTGTRSEPEVIPDINLLEADAYLGLRASHRKPVQIGVDQSYVVPPPDAPRGEKERWLPVTIVDLSVGGARLVCTEPVRSGMVLRMAFDLPRSGGKWQGTGRVTWVSPNGLLAGMAFNPPSGRGESSAHERLKRYVAETQRQALS